MRRLIVMRHAKSDWGTPELPDRQRPLNARGRKDAPRMGAWLARQGYLPDEIRVSPALRTRQTLTLLGSGISTELPPPYFDTRIYEARLSDLLAVLADIPKSSRCSLLLGHNPGLEDLVDHLGGHMLVEPGRQLLPTCTAVVLEMPDVWDALAAGCASLLAYQRPRALD